MRRFFAPGRVNLIGEHTDYSEGLVLPAAINLGITLSCEPAEAIALTSSNDGSRVYVDADGSGATASWGRYVAAVATELALLGRPAVGLQGTVETTLPSGAGLSSSAALEVAVATALCAVAEWRLDPVELAAACRRAEERAVGVPCGIMDQAVSVLGEDGCAILLDCGTLAHEAVPLPPQLELLVVDCGVRHALEHSGYADRRRELEEALPALGGRRPADVAAAEAEELSAGLDDLHQRRLRHVVTENERVRVAVRVLREAEPDLAELGRLFLEGHASQRDDYETTTPELDLLVELAYAHGAVAARMTGGGFGGSIVALVERGRAEAVGEAVADAYAAHGEQRATVRVCNAAAGAHELRVA